jgi:hypothetical protein
VLMIGHRGTPFCSAVTAAGLQRVLRGYPASDRVSRGPHG